MKPAGIFFVAVDLQSAARCKGCEHEIHWRGEDPLRAPGNVVKRPTDGFLSIGYIDNALNAVEMALVKPMDFTKCAERIRLPGGLN